MEYFLSGPGADKEPYNLFKVNHKNGYVTITGIVDREEHSHFNVSFFSFFLKCLVKYETHLKPCSVQLSYRIFLVCQ